MNNSLYDYSPIVDRPKLVWPNDARIAFYIGLNIEHFEVDKPSTSIWPGTATLKPDPLNFGWRDYGARVGIWRMIDALDRFNIRASVLLNSDVCRHYPQIVEAGNERNWAWLAHGKTNSMLHTDLSPDEERALLTDMIDTVYKSTGKVVHGWLGPGLTETFATPRMLKELGLTYVLDWCADDQPFELNVPGMFSVPYSIEVNDVILFMQHGFSGEEFYRVAIDQFERLYEEGQHSGRVMALALHPFVINQPFRQKYLEKVLAYITGRQGVWVTTSDDIAAHYASLCATQATDPSSRLKHSA